MQMEHEDSINLNIIPQTLFCLCCLKQTGPYVNIGACSHREYLDSFPIPNVSPPLSETVCYNCHETLKKIALFRLQVQESFKLLENKINNSEKSTNFKTNLKILEISHLDVPESAGNVEVKSEKELNKATKTKNIEIALKILNTNNASLQSLTSCDKFIGLTKSLLEITANNLNLISTPEPLEPKIKKKSSSNYSAPVLPHETKQGPVIVCEPIVSSTINFDKRIKQEQEDKMHIDVGSISHNHENDNNYPVIDKQLSCNGIVFIQKEPEIQDISENGNISIRNIEYLKNNDSITTVLPKENKKGIHDGVSNGKIMLPERKKDFPEGCLGETRQKECNTISSESSSSIVNDGAGQHKRQSPLCLIPIKLNRRQLFAERREKMNSSGFLIMEYQCRQCITGFRFKENYNDHMKRKHTLRDPVTQVTCEVCHQVVLRGEMRGHMFRHYNRLECKKCKQRFVLFDEAFEHYTSVHTPLQNKTIFKRKLQSYIRWKRLQLRKRNVNKINTKPNTCPTIEAVSMDCIESHPKTP